MSAAKIPKKIDDYYILPLQLPGNHLFDAATHYLYLRRHSPKIPTPDDARTLFAVNIPFDTTEAHLRALFAEIGGGRVESVVFTDRQQQLLQQKTIEATLSSKKKRKRGDDVEEEQGETGLETWDRTLHKSGAHALVVFIDKASCELSLKVAIARSGGKATGALVWGDGGADSGRAPPLGLPRYTSHHRRRFPDRALLQQSVNAFMAMYEEEEAERRRQLARRRQVPDEDGFITVTRPVRQEDAKAAAERQKAKEGELAGFYRFQAREQRKEKQMQLLQRFEEDKKRVAERKEQRKFRPL